MKKIRLVFGVLVLVSFILGCSSNNQEDSEEDIFYLRSPFVLELDKQDLKRMEAFAERFAEGKNDYILAIPPIIDGGYVIYDLRSTGEEIYYMVDSTRDVHSDQGQRKFVCKNIVKREDDRSKDRWVFYLLNCDDGSEELGLFTFKKE